MCYRYKTSWDHECNESPRSAPQNFRKHSIKEQNRGKKSTGKRSQMERHSLLQEPYVRKIPVMEMKQLSMRKKMNSLYTNGSGKNSRPLSGTTLRATAVVKLVITKYFSHFLKHFLLLEGPEAFIAGSWLFDPGSISRGWG